MPPETNAQTRKLYIKTYGCQMNVYDSRRMADVLAPLGFASVDTPEGVDLAILNTCHIREKATEKVYSDLGRLKPHKLARQGEGGRMLIAVAGCVAQAEGAEIMARSKVVDMVFGPQSYHLLPEMVAELSEKGGAARLINTEFPPDSKFDSLPMHTSGQGYTAFLSVQEGCDKFCSFCVVPYTRGAEFSRPVEAVLTEARALAVTGAREITLLGQNVNAYHGEGPDGTSWSLARLLRALEEIEGLDRLRYMTSHPNDMDNDLIAMHGDSAKLMPFMHLPVQSGSDRILDIMNRKHTADGYRRIIERLRNARADIALSSDFIVGYPGETDAEFEETMRLVRDIDFSSTYSFKYSPRPGTPAARQTTPVPEAVKDARLAELQALLGAQQTKFNKSFEGRAVSVLLDRKANRPGQLHGRTPWMQAVHVNVSEQLLGHIVPVKITQGFLVSLTGDHHDTAAA